LYKENESRMDNTKHIRKWIKDEKIDQDKEFIIDKK
jgi:hypothetical protein